MKSHLKILLFLTFVCWCVDATNINSVFEVSDTYQNSDTDTAEDKKLKDFEIKYNFKIKHLVFIPIELKPYDSNYGINDLFFYKVCLEVNAPPPDFKA